MLLGDLRVCFFVCFLPAFLKATTYPRASLSVCVSVGKQLATAYS